MLVHSVDGPPARLVRGAWRSWPLSVAITAAACFTVGPAHAQTSPTQDDDATSAPGSDGVTSGPSEADESVGEETEPDEAGSDVEPSAEEPPTESTESTESTETVEPPAAGRAEEASEAPIGPLVPPGGVPVIRDPRERDRPRPPPPTPPSPPAEPPPVSWMRVEIQPRFNLLLGSSYDDALRAHRAVPNAPAFGGHIGVAFSVAEPWFWLGGRLGLRGRTWRHPDRDGPVATGGDLLLTVGVRGSLGDVVELGAVLFGGLGLVDLRVNGVASGELVPRFGIEGVLAFRVGPNFSFGPRLGWEYFQWDGVSGEDLWLEMGGPFLGLSLEGRL